jgi:hypothetical protein
VIGDGTDIGAFELYAPPPLSLVVSNTNESGAGSLRQSILDIDANVGDITEGTNVITFATNVNGTITLTNGELLISRDLALIGPGANRLAVSGNHASRVFHITNATVSISGLTISNGRADVGGGGVFNQNLSTLLAPTLTISNCTLSGNSATNASAGGGGIYNGGTFAMVTLNLIDSTLSGNSSANNGGGIYNNGFNGSATLTVKGSILRDNSAANGGGIYNNGFNGEAVVTVTATTISSNYAVSGVGGGIINDGGFGSATLTVVASTLCGNSAGSGGGIYNTAFNGSAALEIGDTILMAGASGANIAGGLVTSDGYNLSSDSGGGYLSATGDQIGTDPKLGPLQNNGGPTFTHALLSNSPAIDKGKSLGVTADQRGAPRPFDFASLSNASGGDGSDIGAFELGAPRLNIQRVNANAVLSWPSYYGEITLQSVTNVIASNSWATVAGTPVVVAGQYLLTNGPISGNRFFRLKGN